MNGTNEFMDDVVIRLQSIMSDENVVIVKNVLYMVLNNFDICPKKTEIAIRQEDVDSRAYQMFFVTKKIEGKSDKTVKLYKYVIDRFLNEIKMPITKFTSDHIRFYIAKRTMQDNVCNVTVDNERRIISSLCSFLQSEEYIAKDPSKRVKKIKTPKIVRKPYTGIELEGLRQQAKSLRDKALIEVLYSTGCRVSEVVGMNISDIRGDEMVVTGKGQKQRTVYLNEKAIFTLNNYLNSRKDDVDALFVSLHKPHGRIGSSQIENIIRNLGRQAGIQKSHPHKFRRTHATTAVNRGMPLDEVRELMGHESMSTTLIYVATAMANIKADHKKFIV